MKVVQMIFCWVNICNNSINHKLGMLDEIERVAKGIYLLPRMIRGQAQLLFYHKILKIFITNTFKCSSKIYLFEKMREIIQPNSNSRSNSNNPSKQSCSSFKKYALHFMKIIKICLEYLNIICLCLEIDNNTRMDRPKRPPPPVPKFQDKRDQADLEKKLDSFINEISQSQAQSTPPIQQKTDSILTSSVTPPAPPPPAAKPQPVKEEGGKKKFALASLNSKLNNMLSTKKINVSSALSSEMQKEKHQQKKPIELQYDFQHPNSYELVKQNYASQFAALAEQDSDPQSIEQKEPEQQMDQQYQPEEKEQVALRMMQKFGYKVGEGLGKQSQGIRTPLIVRKTTDSAGIIELSNIPLNFLITREVSAKNALAAHGIEVSEVVVLVGALTMQELEQGLQQQIRQQCCIHGVVCDWLLFLVGEQLCIFVQFQTKDQALHAFAQMNGKYFGEKLVSLRFYPTQLFHERQLNQPTHPHIPL